MRDFSIEYAFVLSDGYTGPGDSSTVASRVVSNYYSVGTALSQPVQPVFPLQVLSPVVLATVVPVSSGFL